MNYIKSILFLSIKVSGFRGHITAAAFGKDSFDLCDLNRNMKADMGLISEILATASMQALMQLKSRAHLSIQVKSSHL
jgi:hypothetical protein